MSECGSPRQYYSLPAPSPAAARGTVRAGGRGWLGRRRSGSPEPGAPEEARLHAQVRGKLAAPVGVGVARSRVASRLAMVSAVCPGPRLRCGGLTVYVMVFICALQSHLVSDLLIPTFRRRGTA